MVIGGNMGRNMEHNYEWKKKNIRRYALTLNRTNEKDVIEHLETKPNKRKYLIEIIREDIKKEKGN